MTDPKTSVADKGSSGSGSSVQQEAEAANKEQNYDKLITLTGDHKENFIRKLGLLACRAQERFVENDKFERFLKNIENRPAIWDTRRKDHSDPEVVSSRWKEISREMNIRREILVRTWNTLKSNLDLVCCMVHSKFLNDEFEEELKIKYPFFKPMMFMKQVQPLWLKATINQKPKPLPPPPTPPSTSATSYPAQSKGDVNNNDEMVIHANENVNELVIYISDESGPAQEAEHQAQAQAQNQAPAEAQNQAPAEAQNQAPAEAQNQAPAESQNQAQKPAEKPVEKKRKIFMRKDVCNKKMLKLEEKLQNSLQKLQNTLHNNIQEQENEDIRFYKTFLPYISKIPAKKRLRFRKRIVEVVEEFTEQSESETEQESPRRPPSPMVVMHNEDSSDSSYM